MLLDKVLKELKLDESEIHMELVADKILLFPWISKLCYSKIQNERERRVWLLFYEFDAHVIIADNKMGKH